MIEPASPNQENAASETPSSEASPSLWQIFIAFLSLGCTSFGGPVAHLAFFRADLVERRHWLSQQHYADVVALSQFLPGPASSQTGIAIGFLKGGWPGLFLAWLGFTLPSAVVMGGLALLSGHLPQSAWSTGLVMGLKAVAVAVVAQAVLGMAKSLCPDRLRAGTALMATAFLVLWPALGLPGFLGNIGIGQVLVILLGGAIGLIFLKGLDEKADNSPMRGTGKAFGTVLIAAFFMLLFGLPIVLATGGGTPNFTSPLAVFDAFYRGGALVFGGGHVVLPLLEADVVGRGWVEREAFLAGYGAAQAMPGPLFTFASFLGPAIAQQHGGELSMGLAFWAIATVAIFVPSFLLIPATLGIWQRFRHFGPARAALLGVNAAVVGLLAAAFWSPVLSYGVTGPTSAALAILAYAALSVLRLPPWLVVILGGAIGGLATLV